MEAVLNKVVKEVVEAQRESDKMFLELEEKRMNHEANQRREEREFQLRMMSMLLARQGHMCPLNHLDPTLLFLVFQIHQITLTCSSYNFYIHAMTFCSRLCVVVLVH